MAYYFGFLPSSKLSDMIDEAQHIIESKSDVDYYPYRNALTQQIARELNDNLLVSLIDVIPNPERKAAMQKIVHTIERATETLLSVLLGKDKNDDIMPSFDFLQHKSMFIDHAGERRIGFKLTDAVAATINDGFSSITPETVDRDRFKIALETMTEESLTHFMTRFTETLNLGIIKRKAVPIAKAAVDKGMNMALNKLLPQLTDDGLNRLATFYRPYLLQIED